MCNYTICMYIYISLSECIWWNCHNTSMVIIIVLICLNSCWFSHQWWTNHLDPPGGLGLAKGVMVTGVTVSPGLVRRKRRKSHGFQGKFEVNMDIIGIGWKFLGISWDLMEIELGFKGFNGIYHQQYVFSGRLWKWDTSPKWQSRGIMMINHSFLGYPIFRSIWFIKAMVLIVKVSIVYSNLINGLHMVLIMVGHQKLVVNVIKDLGMSSKKNHVVNGIYNKGLYGAIHGKTNIILPPAIPSYMGL